MGQCNSTRSPTRPERALPIWWTLDAALGQPGLALLLQKQLQGFTHVQVPVGLVQLLACPRVVFPEGVGVLVLPLQFLGDPLALGAEGDLLAAGRLVAVVELEVVVAFDLDEAGHG